MLVHYCTSEDVTCCLDGIPLLSFCDDPAVLVTQEFNPSSGMLHLRGLMILAPFYYNGQRNLGHLQGYPCGRPKFPSLGLH